MMNISLGDVVQQARGQTDPITVQKLVSLFDPKNIDLYNQLGKTEGIAAKIGTSTTAGLTTEEIKSPKRKATYGENRLPPAPVVTIWELAYEAIQDKTMLLLCGAAVLSIVLNTATATPDHRGTAWIEGFSILMAVAIVVMVTAVNDFQKEKQFRKLNDKKKDHPCKVIRNGVHMTISVLDILVGDLLTIESGEIIPADGLFVEGHNLKMDESSTNGETDTVKKNIEKDPFIISGTQVTDGVGTMIVTNVGVNSFEGKMLMSMRVENESTPLEVKLDALAESIGKAGLGAAIFVIIILVIKHLYTMSSNGESFGLDDVRSIVGFFVVSITIVVVAVPEGLPLSVTIALAYSMLKMLDDKNLVRVLSACETMGSATVICSDKTGTLTQNKMTVVRGCIAGHHFEGADWKGDGCVDIAKVLFTEGVDINSTASEAKNEETGKVQFMGSKTETALLQLSRRLGGDYVKARDELNVIQLYPFSSQLKRMSTVIQAQDCYRMHVKGASETILSLCKFTLSKTGKVELITPALRTEYEELINTYATKGLRTLSIAYVDISKARNWESGVPTDPLTLIAIVGIMDPVRPEVPQAVSDCQNAGITVRMVTGDNAITASHIAKECGIYDPSVGVVMEGPVFRNLTDAELDEVIPKLQVLARSSPLDKQILVQKLKSMGEIVAVTGDGTNDAPALKMANIGFSMGIAGTDVAKEASQIVLMDDNFASIVKAVMWGRNVFDSIRKFLQFQLTVNIVAVSVAIIGSVTSSTGESPLKPVQLLWVNLIMDTLAALALATEPPTRALLDRMPNGQHAPLITKVMWFHVLGQAAYQLVVTLAILYKGPVWFGVGDRSVELNTILFNTFVFCQLFNEINCRRINQELNVFEGFFRNNVFIAVMVITLVVQFIFVEFGGSAAGTVPLSLRLWLTCIGLGFLSLPIGLMLRLLPVNWDTEDEKQILEKEMEAELQGLAEIRSKSQAEQGSTKINIYEASSSNNNHHLSPDNFNIKISPSMDGLSQGTEGRRSRSHSYADKLHIDGAGIMVRSPSMEIRSARAKTNWNGVVTRIRMRKRVLNVFETLHRPVEERRKHGVSDPPAIAKFQDAVRKVSSQQKAVRAFQSNTN